MSKISVTRIAVQNGGVVLTSSDLRGALQQNPDETIAALSKQFAPVQADEVTVDDSGRVVISNAAFVAALGQQVGARGKVVPLGLLDVGCNCSHNLIQC